MYIYLTWQSSVYAPYFHSTPSRNRPPQPASPTSRISTYPCLTLWYRRLCPRNAENPRHDDDLPHPSPPSLLAAPQATCSSLRWRGCLVSLCISATETKRFPLTTMKTKQKATHGIKTINFLPQVLRTYSVDWVNNLQLAIRKNKHIEIDCLQRNHSVKFQIMTQSTFFAAATQFANRHTQRTRFENWSGKRPVTLFLNQTISSFKLFLTFKSVRRNGSHIQIFWCLPRDVSDAREINFLLRNINLPCSGRKRLYRTMGQFDILGCKLAAKGKKCHGFDSDWMGSLSPFKNKQENMESVNRFSLKTMGSSLRVRDGSGNWQRGI